MAENDLELWLHNARSAGLSQEQIIQQLKASGWNDENIGQLFGAPKVEPPTPLAQTTPLHEVTKRFARHLGLFIGIGVGVLLLGGVAFAALRGYIPVPFLAKSTLQEQLEKAIDVLSGSKSGEIGLVMSVKIEPHDGNAKRLPGPKEGEVSPATARSQESQLASDAGQLRTALSLYFDSNQAFPDTLDQLVGTKKYIGRLPEAIPGHEIAYTVSTDKQGYTLRYACVRDASQQGKIDYKSGETKTCLENGANDTLLSTFDSTTLFQFLPTDMEIEGSIVTFVGEQDTNGKKTPRGYVALKGSYSSGGTTISVDGEARMQDGKYYGIVRQFPSLFFMDLTSIKDKWVVIDPAAGDTASDLVPIDALADTTPSNSQLSNAKHETATFIRKALDAKAIVLERQGTETVNGRRLNKIQVTMDADKLPTAVSAYKEDAKNRNALVKEVGESLDELVAPANLESLRVIAGQTSLTIWLENLNATPHKIELTTIVVPPEKIEKLKNKQLRAVIALTFEHLGDQPSVDIPANPITWDEAQRLITGISEEQQKFEKQRTAVDDIRAALTNYRRIHGTYPDALTALLEKPTAVTQDSVWENTGDTYVRSLNADAANYFGDYNRRSAIPQDVFTGKAFPYTKQGVGYTLSYQMVLPKDDGEENFYGTSSYYTDKYVSGKNTATHKTLSQEKQTESDAELGISAEEREKIEQFDAQVKAINNVRSALNAYYANQKKYPENLEALTQNRVNANYSYITGSAIPKDAYTGKDFSYSTTGATYTITYTIHLPSKSTSFSGGLPYISDNQLKQYVEGTNTATQNAVSEEVLNKSYGTSSKNSNVSTAQPTVNTTQLSTGKPLIATPYTSALAGNTGTMHFWVKSENWKAATYMQMVNFLDAKGSERLLVRHAYDGDSWLSYILYPENSSTVGWTAKYSNWQPNVWTHVAITWKVGEVPKLYVNGSLLTEFISTHQTTLVMTETVANTLSTTGTLYLNGRKSSDGGNTEVAKYTIENRVLTAKEIQTISTAGYTVSN